MKKKKVGISPKTAKGTATSPKRKEVHPPSKPMTVRAEREEVSGGAEQQKGPRRREWEMGVGMPQCLHLHKVPEVSPGSDSMILERQRH